MTEVAVIPQDRFNVARLDESALPETWDGMLELLHTAGIEIENAAGVLADEWPAIDKGKLINVPLMLATWSVSKPGEGDNGGQYLVVRGITKDGKRFRFSDGSTGIMKQLVKLTHDRVVAGSATPNAGLLCPTGLTKSDFTYTDDKGKTQPATTYYISAAE